LKLTGRCYDETRTLALASYTGPRLALFRGCGGAGPALAKESFGTIDVIAHRSVAVPGGVETVDFRAQDPDSGFGVLTLRRGSYPAGLGQVAVTNGVAKLLRLDLGSTRAGRTGRQSCSSSSGSWRRS
jgi:hypothetical protein